MMKKNDTNKDKIKHETEYIEFLKKRLNSDHFKQNESAEEIEKTKKKYDKAKLKLRMLTGKC
jgi:hypothetical protein